MEIPRKLKDYIDAHRPGDVPLTDLDEPIGIDSLGVIRLVGFMESELGIQIGDEELLAENFVTLRTLGVLLAKKSPVTDDSDAADSRRV
ncbi:MAG TPA: acyl carrier protein [Chthoniobacterales bacterium]|jgi:acyl carrier protein